MSSLFKTIPGKEIKGFAGKKYPMEFYFQFVPGHVVEVVYSKESLRYNGDRSVNTIIAMPHMRNKGYESMATLGEKRRYYPLLRGITDVPVKGDPVLLCTIGKVNYYLGPLNTITNNPTWNPDPSYSPEPVSTVNRYNGQPVYPIGRRAQGGASLNFNNEIKYSRLEKKWNPVLDYGDQVSETTGDIVIEGRHGNSIRIGSRSNNPYMFISNKRPSTNSRESLTDGSLISILSKGSLIQHFGSYTTFRNAKYTPKGRLKIEESESEKVFGFTLSSDTLEEPNRNMGSIVSNVNNNLDTQEIIYNYGELENQNQMLFHSDRIILNSKRDDIYLSSIKDVHIGTGRHLTISTNQNFIVSCEKTFIGNPTDREDSMEPMVLGTTLLELLKETLGVIKSSQGICNGAPIPLVDATMGPLSAKITQIEQKIDQILSTKHFIEPNA